ncbi:MAG TPA: signal peptide peptidase SppA [Polyangiales bacterium]|nr:signal peptide peptidase SppA [Polyangiales bacterium]
MKHPGLGAAVRASSVVCAVALALGCGAREENKERKLVADSLLEVDLTEPPDERSSELFSESQPSHFQALLRIRKLSADPLAKGLFVRLGNFSGHFGDVDDWAETFETYRAAKKPVHCHFDETDNAGYALASHCDRVSITPSGFLNLVGLAAQVVHARQLLELVGVKAEIFQVGKYKGAAEPFTQDALTPEQRASLDILLLDLDVAFRAHLLRRETRAPEALQKLIDEGPYTAEAAQGAKLVDAVAYDDEARANAKKASNARVIHRPFEPREEQLSLIELARTLAGKRDREYKERPHLAVAFLSGEISDGDRNGVSGGVGSNPFVKAMRKWGDDTNVRAVLLRIESPGGSALASDRMWHAVQRVAKRKPVIVSLGDMAASGGYYIASAGNVIVAAPGSIVGSIGVVGGKMVVAGLTDKLGIHVTALPRAKNAGWLSPFAPFTEGEKHAFTGMLENTYARFLDRVSIGRKLEVKALLPAAEGRVMGGARAKDLGLVDEVGGLARAFTLALERGKLPVNTPIETWPDNEDPLATLTSLMETHAPQGVLASDWLGALPAELTDAGGLWRELARVGERPLAVLPFALHVH